MATILPSNTKSFWTAYVTTAQYDAGKFLHAETNERVFQAAQREERISAKYRPIVLNYNPWNWDWSTHNTTIIQSSSPPPAKKTEKDKQEERAGWAKVVGSIIAIGAAFLVGYAYTPYSRQKETAEYTKDVYYAANLLPEPIRGTFQNLIYHQIKIDDINSAKVNKYFYSAVGLLIGGGALAVGGFGVIPWLMTAGQITLVASIVLTALNLGLHWNDKELLSKHYVAILGNPQTQVQGVADYALQQLAPYNEHMMLPTAPSAPPLYEALYPEYYNAQWGIPLAYAPNYV
jgi:hypothetical protein